MSALDYASEHGYFEIVDLIKSFVTDQSEVFIKDKSSYNLELGEYKLIVKSKAFLEDYLLYFIY